MLIKWGRCVSSNRAVLVYGALGELVQDGEDLLLLFCNAEVSATQYTPVENLLGVHTRQRQPPT